MTGMIIICLCNSIELSDSESTPTGKGGAECGKETNTHFFFSETWLTPPPITLPS